MAASAGVLVTRDRLPMLGPAARPAGADAGAPETSRAGAAPRRLFLFTALGLARDHPGGAGRRGLLAAQATGDPVPLPCQP
jgi:hypothetical protein